jgi:protein-tyrosine phosphatase
VLLSVLFVIVYGGTNWFTAQRSDVGTWYFSWELTAIPFVPLLIVPYMSIDLLFFAAPFLCCDERELRVLTRRITFSILIAAVFFLLMPLKLAWPGRPPVEGWFGTFIETSCTAPFLMEYPHNLFPTLHVALCMILAGTYARHTKGTVRILSNIWFTLIALSTVLTWQHHLVDTAGGFILAAFAMHLFHEFDARLPVVPNLRIGSYYGVGALGLLALMPTAWPWGVFLLWPAGALAIVAAAYFGIGPGIFRKSDGRLPLMTTFVFAPVLIGQYLSLLYYRRRCRAWDEVAPGLFIGGTLTEAEAAEVIDRGVIAVLDLTAEFSETARLRATMYRNLPILDLTAPTREQLHEAIAFIREQAGNGAVYVHCKIGYSRSAAVAGAYLLAQGEVGTAEEAIDRLRQARPSIIIRREAMAVLHTFEREATEHLVTVGGNA